MENQINNHIELKPVKDLLGMNFFIPNYQRGYRWNERRVQDLLDDLKEFISKRTEGAKYCLQPLVVKKRDTNIEDVKNDLKSKIETTYDSLGLQELHKIIDNANQWEVIDGQQRLTTVFLILKCLSDNQESPYAISYETRPGSEDFLDIIAEKSPEEGLAYIDYAYFIRNFQVIKDWFERNSSLKETFKETLLNRTQFIWYESEEKDPIEVFTRLNIGKISLTNSELVKALFLNSSNYGNHSETAHLSQQDIALQWDYIETALQKDEFWCFFHEEGYDQPTRIDYILNIVREKHLSKEDTRNQKSEKDEKGYIEKEQKGYDWWQTIEDHGTDYYQTFRFYDEIFKRHGFKEETIDTIWKEIKKMYDILVEWYNDLEFYHYIGFLIADSEHSKQKTSFDLFKELIMVWEKKEYKVKTEKKKKKISCKDDFVKFLKEQHISKRIGKVLNLDLQYEIGEDSQSKTMTYPLLLLFNIQTIINHNRQFKEDPNFNSADFQRFPFNLFKKEKGWDIEHIAPNTENELETEEARKAWFESARFGFSGEVPDNFSEAIKKFNTFDELKQKLEGNTLDEKERNKIWNFTLLDQSTNRSYGNSIFASKRKEILARDRGKKIERGLETQLERMVYLPPCTRNVFMKYYTKDANNLAEWSSNDALDYKTALYQALSMFGVKTQDPIILKETSDEEK